MTAADYDQYSWDSGRKGGQFTIAVLNGWNKGYCDDRSYGDENNYADFYELWNYAKDIAVGNGEPGTEDYTEAQCANPEVLQSVTAGWVGDSPPPEPDDPPRFREIPDTYVVFGETVSFYVRAYTPANAPATLALVEGDPSATFTDGVFSFTPMASGKYSFVLSAENANGSAIEEFTITVNLETPSTPTIKDITDTSFKVCWNAVAGADNYLVDVESANYDIVVYRKVGNVTEYVVDGLSPGTKYFVWLRACAGNEASGWSGGKQVLTGKKPNAAPEWSAIPVQNAQAGRLSIVDLSKFVSGWPVPDLQLAEGDATLEGTFLEFTPSDIGTNTFTVCASNSLGTASATITVVAGELAPKKFAVCVGINKYENITGLSGCVNDANFMAANLVARGGWDRQDVTVLTDSAATKSAIRGAISNVVAQAIQGDTFIYQHSSHGGQFNATYEPLTDESGLAVFLCVYDEDYYDNTTAYNDYEIAADLAAFSSGVKVAAIVDACHSGGLFKSRDAAKESAASFDLAARVSRIIDSNRKNRKSRGEDVSRSLSADEIGWAVAAEYYEYSYDGGFYNSDKWMQYPLYSEDCWDWISEEDDDGYYDYPDSYKLGGVFMASATWGWWKGGADTDKDGRCDVYEFWQAGYDFCSALGEFWYDNSDYNCYPQCTNVTVLQSIELGWTVSEDVYPEIAEDAAPEVIASALAGSADDAVIEHVTTPAVYSAYRDWGASVKSASAVKSRGNDSSGMAAVRESPYAWASFALGSDTLLGASLEPDDIHIVKFVPSAAAGFFSMEVAVDGIAIGSTEAVPDDLLLANLAQVISVEGAPTPDDAEFDPDLVEAGVSLPEDGKARIEIAQPGGAEFFFRVNVRLD